MFYGIVAWSIMVEVATLADERRPSLWTNFPSITTILTSIITDNRLVLWQAHLAHWRRTDERS